MTPAEITSHIPHLRPHNCLRDGKIYFMISSRPMLELSCEEMALYRDIDGSKTAAELEEVHPGACDRLLKWREAQILELIPPQSAPAHPHLVVIEPHMDDAVLSAGGRLLHQRGHARITILSVVKWSNFTSYLLLKRDFFDLQAVTALRQRESDLAAKLLGAEHRTLDWSDAPIRFWPGERWSATTVQRLADTPHAFVKLFPSPAEVSLLAEQLADTLHQLAPDELWIPMGLGDHVDHRTTRSACLQMLTDPRQRLEGIPVSMYEDLPYAATEGHATQIRNALVNCGTGVCRVIEDITDVFEDKLRVASTYASQFKLSYMEPLLHRFAETEGAAQGRLAEAYYRLEGSLSVPDECLLSRECEGLKGLKSGARELASNGHQRRRLTIMAFPSGQFGRWESIQQCLINVFPAAEFRVYVSDDAAWQLEACGHEKFELHIVQGGSIRWFRWFSIIFRELRFRTPVIVLWRGAYASEPMSMVKKVINVLIRFLLAFRRIVFARTLWDVCLMVEPLENPKVPEKRIADLEVA